jgi:hypothetical protein
MVMEKSDGLLQNKQTNEQTNLRSYIIFKNKFEMEHIPNQS